MAEDRDQVEQTDEQPQVFTKRRLRTSGESVRERTEKLQQQKQSEESDKHTIFSAFWSGFGWPLRIIGRGLASLGRFRVIRLIVRIIFPRYFRRSWRELRLVTWPNRVQSWKLTYAVIIFSVIFGALVAIVDYGLDKLFKEFLIK